MITLLINPTAGNGRTVKNQLLVEELLSKRNLEYEVKYTTAKGTETGIAQDAKLLNRDLIVMGGDGTFYAALNGYKGATGTLYFAPSGTGNDFIKAVNLPNDPVEALKIQLEAPQRQIDYGMLNEYAFLNVSGTGFDAQVLKGVDKYKKNFKGLLPYLFALFETLKSFKPIKLRVSIDGGEETESTYSIISIGNGNYIGGGMKAVPNGSPINGKLCCVLIDGVSKPRVLWLLPKFIAGKHLSIKEVKECFVDSVTIEGKGLTFNLDGELIDMDRAEYKIVKNGLNVRLPL